MGLGDFLKDNAGLIGTGIGAFFGGPAGAAIGGGLGGLVSANSKSKDPTVTPKAAALEEVKPHLGTFFGGGADLFQAQKPIATEALNTIVPQALSTLQGNLSPQAQNIIGTALKPVQEQLTEQILPGISSAANLAGATGGARQDILTQQALQDFLETSGDIASRIGYQEYVNAPARIGSALNLSALPLANFGDVLSTSPAGTAIETGPSPRAAALQGTIGGALSGYQLGGGYGAGIGSALGGYLGGIR